MRKFLTLTVLAAVLVLSAFMLAGCGDNDSTSGDETRVVIGFAGPLTGDNALYGTSMLDAVHIAIDELNASSEARQKGIVFSVRAEDDAGDPKQAVNVANTLVADQNVIAVVGHFNSGASIPASAVYEEYDLSMVTVSTNPQLTDSGLSVVNRITARDDSQGPFAAEIADEEGFERVAVLDDSTPYGQGLAAEFVKAFEELGGEIVSEDQIQPKTVDFSALVTRIGATSPDAVYYAGAHTEGALFAKQLREAGVDIPVIGGEMIFTSDYITLGGSGTEGDIATALGLPIEQQERGLEFLEKYRERYNREPEAYDTYAFDSAMLIGQAVFEAPELTRVAVGQAIRNITHNGVTGTISFDSRGDNTQQIISAYIVLDGAWEPLIRR
ncbi:MAG: branched-chain amino acid ABC transporter substrate-binding protein [Coriobacteriia bacterium]|nr:branched-chain amino acid ABC transporter substrate-binding protein [Coriobacteriia bacterium]